MKQPKLNRIGWLVFVVFVLKTFFTYLLPRIVPYFLPPNEVAQFYVNEHPLSILLVISKYSINILLALWIIFTYKGSNNKKWGWGFLTLIFGIDGIIIFYLDQLFFKDQLKNDSINV